MSIAEYTDGSVVIVCRAPLLQRRHAIYAAHCALRGGAAPLSRGHVTRDVTSHVTSSLIPSVPPPPPPAAAAAGA